VAGRAWVTEGQASDIAHARAALEAGAVPTPRGPARTRPGILSGDKACSSRAFRNYLRRRKIRHVIPEPDNQKANRINRGSAGGRPTGFDRPTYKIRNTVERCFSKLKQFRGFATRYDKLSTRYQAGIHLISTIVWLRTH
jgi:transposase